MRDAISVRPAVCLSVRPCFSIHFRLVTALLSFLSLSLSLFAHKSNRMEIAVLMICGFAVFDFIFPYFFSFLGRALN